jgi:hypothetical protein
MLDGFALYDLNTPAIRALQRPVAACTALAPERKDDHDPLRHWRVMMPNASSSSSTAITLTAGPGAWMGDIPLVPRAAVSDELAAWIRFATVTPRSIIR